MILIFFLLREYSTAVCHRRLVLCGFAVQLLRRKYITIIKLSLWPPKFGINFKTVFSSYFKSIIFLLKSMQRSYAAKMTMDKGL